MDTTYNEENGTISAAVNLGGAYMAISLYDYFYNSNLKNVSEIVSLAEVDIVNDENRRQDDTGCWVKLSGGLEVYLDKDPLLEDSSVDTDGDGISDAEELGDYCEIQEFNPLTNEVQVTRYWKICSNPAQKDTDNDGIDDGEDFNPTRFDVVPIEVNEFVLAFNTGRAWYMNDYTAEEIWAAHKRLEASEYDFNMNPGNSKEILSCAAEIINSNNLQSFTTEELLFVALLDGDGIRFYLDSKPVADREALFELLYGRKTDYYQQQGLINRTWQKVSGYEANGFFKGEVLSEADVVFSFEELKTKELNAVIDFVTVTGIVMITTLVVLEVGSVLAANIKALSSYITHYGIKNGIDFYLTLGASRAPVFQTSVMQALTVELTDGDDDEYRLIDYVDDVVSTDKDGWAMTPVNRGIYYDNTFGNNLGYNYPVIDKLENRVITSIKSVDIRLKSYQSTSGIYNKIVKDASALSKFDGKKWAGVVINSEHFDSRVLHVILPDTTITTEQMLGLEAAKVYIMNNYNIQLYLTVATQ